MLSKVLITPIAGAERAIEDGFPFEEISEIAEIESWRKEIYRPIYHIHKWWAQRLGSVFRAIILAAALPKDANVRQLFYEPVRLPNLVVFDPFMGSGTTVGEAHRLGCNAIGRDINPVAYFAVRTALGPVERSEVLKAFHQLESSVGEELRTLYRSTDSLGRPCDVLYYFWVKTLPCPHCGTPVDLFSRFIFASHAYPHKHREARAVCPWCGEINLVENDSRRHQCTGCAQSFDPLRGWARRVTALCPNCGHEFRMAETARNNGQPPDHRMYAKLVLTQEGKKEYLRVTDPDLESYRQAKERLKKLSSPYPMVEIPDGYNTRQVLNYGYRYWHQMFNARQLLGLSLLARAIAEIDNAPARDALACLFSGVLEFNNMFASYKGEGTGAVRHMFAHHILKPERTPLEANIWGTPRSSGSFSTLFRSRLLRALDYRDNPFEVVPEKSGQRKKGRKVFGVGQPIHASIVDMYPRNGLAANQIYLSCASSAHTDLPSKNVDLVITDPPFFDNVHYSELADFFYVWQAHFFSPAGAHPKTTTRHPEEVQAREPASFTKNLRRVFEECHRVLNDEGLLLFTYHHSREEGWSALASAVLEAGFEFVQAHPVKAEMSVAMPKTQAKHPIDLDIILVCRKREHSSRSRLASSEALRAAVYACENKVRRFNAVGRYLSRGDVQIILYAELLIALSPQRQGDEVTQVLKALQERCKRAASEIYATQEEVTAGPPGPEEAKPITSEAERASGIYPEAV